MLGESAEVYAGFSLGGMKIGFGFLGYGLHASRRLLAGFAKAREVEAVGLWRRNAEAGAANAKATGMKAYGSAEELCASAEIDAVFITSPDALHLEHARIAFAHGKAVLCEKPLAMNAGQAAEMQALAEAAGVLFGVGQNFRWNRSLEWMREQIAAGRIGTPQIAHAQFNYLANLASRTWIADAALACGGPIADVGVHCIDALRFILQDEVKTISVLASRDAHSGEVEAMATMQMQMRSGMYATVDTSARAPYRTLLEVVGSDGMLSAENGLTVDKPVEVVLRKGGEVVETKTLNNGDGYARMLDAFARAMRGDGVFAASGADGVVNQRILDAAYRSWHSGLRETL